MARYMREDEDKRNRCPDCWCVMPWRYKPVRRWLFGDINGLPSRLMRFPFWVRRVWATIDCLFPRRCRGCRDVIVLPTWLARPLNIH